MSLWTQRAVMPTAETLVADRMGMRAGMVVTGETARRHSAVWACLRLRGDLVSTLPIDAYRSIDGIQIEVPKPPMLVNPGGDRVNILEWRYSSQNDLDSTGNAFGLITAKDARGLPARIDLQPVSECTVRVKDGDVWKYRISGKDYDPDQVWHEKQFTASGLAVGLSPIAYAAYSIGGYLSANDFAAQWFAGGATPTASLKNTAKTLNAADAGLVKQRFKAAVANHDIFVHGSDWDYNMISVPANQAQFIEMMQWSVSDVARYFGCPGDMIDAAVSGQSVTYANITQRNLEFLIMHLQPALTRREWSLSTWLPRGQFVKFNADALLRMDPLMRADVIGKQIYARTLAPSEARKMENRPPLTPEQTAEFDHFWPPKPQSQTGLR